MHSHFLWAVLLPGYMLTVLIEGAILWIGLRPVHDRRDRLIAAFLLTGFTYPVVVLVLPTLFAFCGVQSRVAYLLAAETYAPGAEVLLFRFLHRQSLLRMPDRDAWCIVVANLASFAAGEAGLSRLLRAWVEG